MNDNNNNNNNNSDGGVFRSMTTEYTVDYETMAHEAALGYFKILKSKEILPSEFTKVYLSIYKDILAGLEAQE